MRLTSAAVCASDPTRNSKQGTPLTKKQVEEIRDGAQCMMMKHRDAQKMERGRGYADIDPELAYEQWCVVRENRDEDGE